MNAHVLPPDRLKLHLQPKQWAAFLSSATELLYGGAAFGGKSHLMRVAAIVWCAGIAGLQVYLFRRIREDLIKNHMEGRSSFGMLLAPWIVSGKCRIVEDEIRFWNGSKIFLCHCKDEKDKYKYLGSEMHVLLMDELTHFTGAIYQFLRTRVRMVGIDLPEQYRGKFPRILCASNPGNVGHLWVKQAFVASCEPGKIRQMPPSEGGMRRQFIPARLDDNQIGMEADPLYEQRLEGIGSAAQVKAYRWGDWDVIEGAFFDCWSHERHVIPPFTVPRDWLRYRSGDWGSADDELRVCPRCRQGFTCNKYAKQVHCSQACAQPGTHERKLRSFICRECRDLFVAKDTRAIWCSGACRKRNARRAAKGLQSIRS
jgi:hypothetical protein